MIELTKEQDLETLRQISLLLDRENQRLITKTLELTAEVARLQGVPNPEQLQLAVVQDLQRRRAQLLQPPAAREARSAAASNRPAQPGHGPRPQRHSRSWTFGTNCRSIGSARRAAAS